jgi:hypothetical protein
MQIIFIYIITEKIFFVKIFLAILYCLVLLIRP